MINQLPGTSGVDYGAWLATGNNPTMNPSTMAAAGFGSPVPNTLTGTGGIGYVNQPGQPQGMNTAQLSQAQQLMGGGVLPNPALQGATQQMGGQMQNQMRQNQVQNRLAQGNWDQLNTNAQSKLGAALGGQSSAFSSPVPGQLTGTPVPGQLTGTPVPGQLTGTTGYSQSDIQGRLSQGSWDQLNPDAQAKLSAAMLANPAAFGLPQQQTSSPVPGQLTGSPVPGQLTGTQPTAPQTGYPNTVLPGDGSNTSQALADYWSQNPGALNNAVLQNPSAFAGAAGAQNFDTTMNAAGVPQTGVIGAEDIMRTALNAGMAANYGGLSMAQNTMTPWLQAGGGSTDYMSALSGASGQAAQAEALAGYMESPGQAYLREMGEKAITRNASALGGLGGGNVMQELQRHGIGLAAQDFDNNFQRLGMLSSMGANSANSLGSLQAQGGFQNADMAYGTGQSMAAGRYDAGNRISDAVGSTSSALSNLISQQGQDITGQIDDFSGNLASILMAAGKDAGLSATQLQTILSNISTGQASQVAILPSIPGVQQTDSKMGDVGSLVQAGAAIFSDRRLKTNITPIGRTHGGNTLYTWDWNAEGRRLAGSQPGIGVIAQEVNDDAVILGPDGYLMVDYTRVL